MTNAFPLHISSLWLPAVCQLLNFTLQFSGSRSIGVVLGLFEDSLFEERCKVTQVSLGNGLAVVRGDRTVRETGTQRYERLQVRLKTQFKEVKTIARFGLETTKKLRDFFTVKLIFQKLNFYVGFQKHFKIQHLIPLK